MLNHLLISHPVVLFLLLSPRNVLFLMTRSKLSKISSCGWFCSLEAALLPGSQLSACPNDIQVIYYTSYMYLYVYAVYLELSCSEVPALSSGWALCSVDGLYIKSICFVGSQVGIFSVLIILILTITHSLLKPKVHVSVHLSCSVFIENFTSFFRACYL